MGDLIFFAAIAAFVGFRLYHALGNKNFEPGKVATYPAEAAQGKVISTNYTEVKPADEDKELEDKYGAEIAASIKEIRKIDRNFNMDNFINGAKYAFEMIIKAFSKGDKEALKPLLAPEVYNNFEAEIDKRQNSGQVEETTLVAINSAKIRNIGISKKYARIAVEIVSEQVNIIRDLQGAIIAGNPSQVDRLAEVWIFGRSLDSSNPNWELLGTAPA